LTWYNVTVTKTNSVNTGINTINGNFFLAGLTKGMDLTTSTISSGAQMGDMSGYKLEFQGMEPLPANFVTGPLTTGILASIVEGTVA
jgi:hypothetical protein